MPPTRTSLDHLRRLARDGDKTAATELQRLAERLGLTDLVSEAFVLATDDLDTVVQTGARAWQDEDEAMLTACGELLGVRLDLETARRFDDAQASRGAPYPQHRLSPSAILATLGHACIAEHGVEYAVAGRPRGRYGSTRSIVLAVAVDPERLVVDIATVSRTATTPATAWPALRGWRDNSTSSQTRAHAWARDALHDDTCIVIERTALPVARADAAARDALLHELQQLWNHKTPERTFQRALALLARWPVDHGRADGVAWIASRTGSWTPDTRVAPETWWTDALDHDPIDDAHPLSLPRQVQATLRPDSAHLPTALRFVEVLDLRLLLDPSQTHQLITSLVESPHLTQLTRLRLSMRHANLDAVAHLTAATHLTHLSSLELVADIPDDTPTDLALTGLPALTSLTIGHLSTTPLDPDTLLRAPRARLHTLHLHGLDDDALTRLAERPCLGHLTVLGLQGAFTDQGCRALAQGGFAHRLQTLAIESDTVSESTLEHLASALPSLTTIQRRLPPASWPWLRTEPRWPAPPLPEATAALPVPRSPHGHHDTVLDLVSLPHQRLASCAADGLIVIWRLDDDDDDERGGRALTPEHVLHARRPAACVVTLAVAGDHLWASDGHQLLSWPLDTLSPDIAPRLHTRRRGIRHLAGAERRLAALTDHEVAVLTVTRSGTLRKMFGVEHERGHRVELSHDGATLLVTHRTGTLTRYDLADRNARPTSLDTSGGGALACDGHHVLAPHSEWVYRTTMGRGAFKPDKRRVRPSPLRRAFVSLASAPGRDLAAVRAGECVRVVDLDTLDVRVHWEPAPHATLPTTDLGTPAWLHDCVALDPQTPDRPRFIGATTAAQLDDDMGLTVGTVAGTVAFVDGDSARETAWLGHTREEIVPGLATRHAAVDALGSGRHDDTAIILDATGRILEIDLLEGTVTPAAHTLELGAEHLAQRFRPYFAVTPRHGGGYALFRYGAVDTFDARGRPLWSQSWPEAVFVRAATVTRDGREASVLVTHGDQARLITMSLDDGACREVQLAGFQRGDLPVVDGCSLSWVLMWARDELLACAEIGRSYTLYRIDLSARSLQPLGGPFRNLPSVTPLQGHLCTQLVGDEWTLLSSHDARVVARCPAPSRTSSNRIAAATDDLALVVTSADGAAEGLDVWSGDGRWLARTHGHPTPVRDCWFARDRPSCVTLDHSGNLRHWQLGALRDRADA